MSRNERLEEQQVLSDVIVDAIMSWCQVNQFDKYDANEDIICVLGNLRKQWLLYVNEES